MIGRKQLSPVELLESCIARIEAVDAAVNAVVARDYERRSRGRRTRRGGGGLRRGSAAAAWPADRRQGPHRHRRAAHHLGQPDLPRPCPGQRRRRGREHSRRRRDRARQDQHAGMGGRGQYPQCRLWRHRQPVRSQEIGGRFLGRLGRRAGDGHAALVHRQRHGRVVAQSRRPSAGSSASAPPRAWSRARPVTSAGRASAWTDRWRARSAMSRLLLSAMVFGRCARPARHHDPRQARPPDARISLQPRPCRPCAGSRRVHARFRLRPDGAAYRRGVRREDRAVPRRLRPIARTPLPTAAVPTKPSRSCAP